MSLIKGIPVMTDTLIFQGKVFNTDGGGGRRCVQSN